MEFASNLGALFVELPPSAKAICQLHCILLISSGFLCILLNRFPEKPDEVHTEGGVTFYKKMKICFESVRFNLVVFGGIWGCCEVGHIF